MSEVIFKPNPGPQTVLLQTPVHNVFFGGARFGGKSIGALGHFAAKAARAYSKSGLDGIFRGLCVRRTLNELTSLIEEAKKMFVGIADFNITKKTFTFRAGPPFGGAVLIFNYLSNDSDAELYQGHSYQWFYVEEIQNFPSPKPIDILYATLRSPHDIDVYFIATGNPGGTGHNWVKARFVDPAPAGTPFKWTIDVDGTPFKIWQLFISATLDDNPHAMKDKRGYEARLAAASSGDKGLYDAWRYGNWNMVNVGGIFSGVYDEKIHLLKPFEIPSNWEITSSFDWGSAKPFSVGWWAESNGEAVSVLGADGKMSSRVFYPGTLIRIGEWYGSVGLGRNEGLRMHNREIAQGIVKAEQEAGWEVSWGVADSAIFTKIDDVSIYDEYEAQGINWYPSAKGPGSRVVGWELFKQMLSNAKSYPMEAPGLFFFDSCRESARLVPSSVRSTKNPEDLDSASEDHLQDEIRYRLTAEEKGVSFMEIGGT